MNGIDGKEDAIELALQEALANAVIHGAKRGPPKVVECLVSTDQERGIRSWSGIRYRIYSRGRTRLHRRRREYLFQPRARNFSIIVRLMDKVEFRKNGTEIRMVKR